MTTPRQRPRHATRGHVLAVRDVLARLGATSPDRALPKRTVLEALATDVRFPRTPSFERMFRQAISDGILHGVPLASTNAGYFVATAAEHLDPCIADLMSRIRVLRERVVAFERQQSTWQQRRLA